MSKIIYRAVLFSIISQLSFICLTSAEVRPTTVHPQGVSPKILKLNDVLSDKMKSLEFSSAAKSSATADVKSAPRLTPKLPEPKTNPKDTKSKDKDDSTTKSSGAAATPAASAVGGPGGNGGLSSTIPTSVQVDPFSGMATMAIPIEIPTGRSGMQPTIALQYSSSNPYWTVGVGWQLEMGSIQISTKNGIPTYNESTDDYLLLMPGATQELVYDQTRGYYRTKIEGGFSKIRKVANHWEMTDTKGTKYFFGQTIDTQETDETNTARIFRWCLDRVEDVNGNYYTIRYQNSYVKVPDLIEYTGNTQGLPVYARISLNYNESPTIAGRIVSVSSGYYRHIPNFLTTIDVRVKKATSSDFDVKSSYRYFITYADSQQSGRKLLASIKKIGTDGVGELPATTFTYSDNQPLNYTLQSLPQAQIPYFPVDFNSDGKTDRGTYFTNGQFNVALSNGNGFNGESSWLNNFAHSQMYVGNVDQNGYPDLIGFQSSTGTWRIAYGNGSSFTAQSSNVLTSFGTNQSEVGTGDLNGDGYVDLYYIEKVVNTTSSTTYYYLHQAINDRNSKFNVNPQRITITIAPSADNLKLIPADINNDGITDFVSFTKATGKWNVLFQTYPLTYTVYLAYTLISSGFGNGFEPLVIDFNGDGNADLGYYNYQEKKLYYRTSNGTRKISAATFIHPVNFTQSASDTIVIPGDFNADGLADLILTQPTPTGPADYAVSSNQNNFADLLTKVDNGVGGTTTISYRSSLLYPNTFLPFLIPVVDSVTTSNNLGDAYTISYSYKNGLWNSPSREFLGFGTVRATDSEGNYSETDFYQDAYRKGMAQEQRSFDKLDHLFSRTVSDWQTQNLGWSSQFVFLKRNVSFLYEGDANQANAKATAEEYFYDGSPLTGNLVKTIQYGEVSPSSTASNIIDSGTDSRRVENDYFTDTIFPSQIRVYDHLSNLLQKSDFAYDTLDYGQTPTKGLLTKKKVWGGNQPGAQNPETKFVYDAYGNLVSTTDPKGQSTTITYNPTYKLFPLTVTNALGQTTTNKYFRINEGVPVTGCTGLFGELFLTEDPNGNAVQRCYDNWGRQWKVFAPLNSFTYPTTEVQYSYGTNFTRVTSKQRVVAEQNPTLDTYQFIDGLGRPIQNITPTETPGKYIVSGMTTYNSRGLPVDQYQSFYTTGAIDAPVSLPPGIPKTTLEYDNMGRVIKTILPDGSYSSVNYQKWRTETIDENGHKQAAEVDAFGQLIKREEYSGADGRGAPTYPAVGYQVYATTQYQYDTLGNLTKTIDAQGNQTVITYNTLGRKIAMDDPDMGHWTYAYDLNGNLLGQTDNKGQTINFDYDALNRLKRKYDQQNLDVNYTYDAPTEANSKGRLTKAAYNAENTQFKYDVLGREVQATKNLNSQNYTVQRSYNILNQLVDLTYSDGRKLYYKYNNAGQIEKIGTDPSILGSGSSSGSSVKIDSISPSTSPALSTVTVAGSGFGSYPTTTYNADADVNRDGIVDILDATSVSVLWQVTSGQPGYKPAADVNHDGVINNIDFNIVSASWQSQRPASYVLFGTIWAKVISWSDTQIRCVVPYDAQSGNVKVVTAAGTSNVVTFTVGTGLPAALVEDVRYDVNGQITHFRLGNGTTTDYTYDPLLQRMTRTLTKSADGAVIQDSNYQYDHVGNIVQISDNINTATQIFRYDHLNRLVHAENPAKYGTKDYVYDAIGNIVQKDGKTYSYGDGPAGPHAVTATIGNGSTSTYTYDDNGNMATKQTGSEIVVYSYDIENRLIKIMKNAATIAEYKYDGDGGRTQKKKYQNGSVSETTEFIGGLSERTSGQQVDYLFLGSTRIASLSGNDVMFYHQDHLGGTNVITDATGAVKEIVEYEPFGDDARHDKFGTSPQVAHYYFSNHFKDEESGLIFMQARYYDPKLGRFLTPDTIVQDPSNPQTLNRYSYCSNNPVNYVDMDGHKWSWKNFWKSFVGGLVSAITAIFLGPALGPILAGTLAGGLGGGVSAALGGGSFGRGFGYGAGFGLATGLAGYGISQAFGNIGRQIYDSSIVIASGINGMQNGGTEGFIGGVLGSGLVTGVNSGWRYDTAPPAGEAQVPHGFWDTVLDVGMFCASLKAFNEDRSFINGIGLFADGLALLAPGVPAVGGAGVRATKAIAKAKHGNAVIGKINDLKNLRAGENSLLKHMGNNLGSPKANWHQNSSVLRIEMQKGFPIRDVSPGIESGFLGAEKNLLRNFGWKSREIDGDAWWVPPGY